MNPVQERQEKLYTILLDVFKQDNNFTFWLTQSDYRFNRGKDNYGKNIIKGYTDVGIVKIGSNSNTQWAGFQFTENFTKCFVRISDRKDDFSKFTDAAKKHYKNLTSNNIQDFLYFISNKMQEFNLTNITSFDPQLSNWLKNAYDTFFRFVKEFDDSNNTPFYNLLKIDLDTFMKKREKSDLKNRASNKTVNNGVNGETLKVSIPLNQILYGPPGTGKTWNTVEMAIKILEPSNGSDWKDKKKRFDTFRNQGQIVFTTFHQSMSYEDFVEGIKPIPMNNVGITYDVKPGIFKELCEDAIKYENKKYVLIIDEINRGNVSQIFGELITLLEEDKRLGQEFELKIKLPYSSKDFGVPSNLYIIGTMNTADRSVEALDTALRRRFSFIEMMPNPGLLNNKNIDGVNLSKILKKINDRIVVLKDREHQIGHSYFMNDCNTKDDLKAVFKNKIIPLLQEYFYGNYENIRLVLGNSFVKKNQNVVFADGSSSDSIEQLQYNLLTEEEWKQLDITTAIQNLMDKPSGTGENNQQDETPE